MNCPRSLLALAGSLLSAACSTTPRVIDANTGSVVQITAVAAACIDQDVIFFGEVHPSDECHEQQRQLLDALRKRHKDVVVSMEMFERDVQDKLDAYLAGRLMEPDFRKQARAWKNWDHYKPIVQIAAMHELPVIAANAPKKLVGMVSRKDGGGLAAVRGNPHVARKILTPKDAYFDAFVAVMKEHIGTTSPEAMQRMYEAQVVRDETMAESIADYLAAAHKAGRRPLVLHLCGNFHSVARRGTVQRLLRRNPKLAIKVIATSEGKTPATTDGDFLIAVAKQPKAKPVVPTHATAKSGEKPAPDPNARPGLGFMPVYEQGDEPGCGVQMVMEGSAAEKAGIEKGDLIIRLDGEEIGDVREYSDVLGGLEIGSTVKVVVKRGDKTLKLVAIVGESHR